MLRETDVKSIDALLHSYAAYVNEQNEEALAGLYAADGIFMPNGYKSIVGKASIEKTATRKFDSSRFRMMYEIQDIAFRENMAVVTAIAETTSSTPGSSGSQTKKSRDLFVLQQSAQGWEIIRYMFNDL